MFDWCKRSLKASRVSNIVNCLLTSQNNIKFKIDERNILFTKVQFRARNSSSKEIAYKQDMHKVTIKSYAAYQMWLQHQSSPNVQLYCHVNSTNHSPSLKQTFVADIQSKKNSSKRQVVWPMHFSPVRLDLFGHADMNLSSNFFAIPKTHVYKKKIIDCQNSSM